MMRKTVYVWMVLMLISALVLAACGATGEAPAGEAPVEAEADVAVETAAEDGAAEGPAPDDSEGEADPAIDLESQDLAARLVVLTYYLEGTDLQVSPEQAGALLPLWKAVRAISDSDTAAAEELYAVYRQIAGEMTDEQLAQLENAYTDQTDVQALMQELGVEPENPNGTGDRTGTGGPGSGTGGGPGGGVGNGTGEGSGMELTPEQQATLQAERQALAGRGIGQAANMLEPLIELLETRAAE